MLLPTQIFRVYSTPLLYLDDGVLELHPGKTIDQINSKSSHRFGLVIGKELNPFRVLAKVLVKGLSIYCRGPDDAIRTAVDRGQRHLFLVPNMQCAEELVRGHHRKGNWLLHVCLPEGLVAWDIIARYIVLVLICISMLGSLGHHQDLWLAVKVPLFGGGSVRHRLAVAVEISHRLRPHAAASAHVARPGPLSMVAPLKHHLDVLSLVSEAQRGHDDRGLPHIVTGVGGIGASELWERLSWGLLVLDGSEEGALLGAHFHLLVVGLGARANLCGGTTDDRRRHRICCHKSPGAVIIGVLIGVFFVGSLHAGKRSAVL